MCQLSSKTLSHSSLCPTCEIRISHFIEEKIVAHEVRCLDQGQIVRN